jgi:hypothetical protein
LVESLENTHKSTLTRLISEHLLAISIFLILTIILTFPVILNFVTESAGEGCYDKCHMMWRWWWTSFSIENGLDSNYTNYLFYPDGAQISGNLAQFTTSVAYMLLQFFNYTVTWNLIWISSFIFGGYGAFLLANHFNKNFYTSIIAGIIFTFSTYHMAQSNVHIGLSMIVFIPIFVLILFKISEKNSKIYAILGGVFFFLASMSHVYYFISLLIFSGIFLAFYIFKQKKISNSVFVTNFSITIIIGIIAALIVFSPVLSTSDDLHKRPLGEHVSFSANLENFVIPTTLHSHQYFSGNSLINSLFLTFNQPNCENNSAESTTKRVEGMPPPTFKDLPPTCIDHPTYRLEQKIFLGYSVIFLASLSIAKFRNTGTWFWLLSCGVFAVLCLGPELKFYNNFIGISLPEKILYENIPWWDDFRSPARFIVMVNLGMSILASTAVYGLIKKNFFVKKKQYVLIGIIAAIILFELSTVPYSTHAESIPKGYEMIKNDKSNFLIFESPNGGTGDFGLLTSPSFQYYQTYHEKPIYGGHESRVPLDTLSNSSTYFLNMFHFYGKKADIINQDLKIHGTSLFNYYDIKYLVIHKTLEELAFFQNYNSKIFVPQTIALMNEILETKKPFYEDEEIIVYKIPKTQSTKPFILLGSGWQSFESPAQLLIGPEGQISTSGNRLMEQYSEIILVNPNSNVINVSLEIEVQAVKTTKTVQFFINEEYLFDLEVPTMKSNIKFEGIKLQPGKNIISLDSVQYETFVEPTFLTEYKISLVGYGISLLE